MTPQERWKSIISGVLGNPDPTLQQLQKSAQVCWNIDPYRLAIYDPNTGEKKPDPTPNELVVTAGRTVRQYLSNLLSADADRVALEENEQNLDQSRGNYIGDWPDDPNDPSTQSLNPGDEPLPPIDEGLTP